jgi:dTDP-4-amino-4,6-dideoxygalactose transaminase
MPFYQMSFIDLAAQQKLIRSEIEKKIAAVLDHGQYVMGPEVELLERQLASFTGVRHAVACASGTDALLMALMASGVGPGDAVFTSPFTFIATAEAVQILGATPVFVDIEPSTFNMDASKLATAITALRERNPARHPLPACAKAITPKAVIAVDLFGLPADYDTITPLTDREGLVLIEDAAQSFGAAYKGKRACTFGAIACTSFFPAKPLGAYGDAGMCFTDDETLAAAMRSIRNHGGGGDRYEHVRLGLNGRLDTIQAAVLLAKFTIFQEEIQWRQEAAERYAHLLADIPGVTLPNFFDDKHSVWAQYSVQARDAARRNRLRAELKDAGIPTAVYYPTPLHLQPVFRYLAYQAGDFPVSETTARRIFSLPMHPYLKAADQEKIARIIAAEARS